MFLNKLFKIYLFIPLLNYWENSALLVLVLISVEFRSIILSLICIFWLVQFLRRYPYFFEYFNYYF